MTVLATVHVHASEPQFTPTSKHACNSVSFD